MDWLESISPMHVHWGEKWIQFGEKENSARIQGITPHTVVGNPVSSSQLEAMIKHDSLLYCVQLNSVYQIQYEDKDIPPEISALITQYSSIFQPLPGLPPRRSGDHVIPLLPGTTPFRLRPYRYNPF